TAIPPVVEVVRILKGAECNILDETGRIDLEPEMLRQLEWRIASIHAPCYKKDATLEDNTNAYLGVCENPYIDVIGHSGRGSFRYDYQKLIPLFGERGKLVEINESTLKSPSSRKNCTEIATLCKKYRVPVIVDSDAHFALSIGRFSAAAEMLKEIEFPEELVINADSDRFWHYLEQKGIQKNPEW
ncbi:MAG TPA: phosphatase, partial [Candidatus Egerieicola pullicola]|nr:phosphatase [Candidatus Egerieicola pullicola]